MKKTGKQTFIKAVLKGIADANAGKTILNKGARPTYYTLEATDDALTKSKM